MTEPTDNELEALIAANLLVVDGGQCAFESWADIRPELVKFARDVLAKWGTPSAVAGEPVAWRIDALELEVRQLTERTAALQKPYEKGKHMTPEQHAAAIEDAVEFYLNASIGMLHFVERVDLREFAKTARQELQAAIIAGVGAAAMTPTRTR